MSMKALITTATHETNEDGPQENWVTPIKERIKYSDGPRRSRDEQQHSKKRPTDHVKGQTPEHLLFE